MRVRPFMPQTLGIDPDSPTAHANLAVYFFTLVAMGMLRPDEGMPATRAAAQRALELDPSIAEAHALSALVASLYDRDWATAEQRFQAALSREPVPASVSFHYAAWHLSPLRRHTEALPQVKLGLADDPLYLLGRIQLGQELQSLGRSEEGLAELEAILRIDPRFGPALGLVGRELAMRGHVAEALSLADETFQAAPRHPKLLDSLPACCDGPARRNVPMPSCLRWTVTPRGRALERAPRRTWFAWSSTLRSMRSRPRAMPAILASGWWWRVQPGQRFGR